MDWVEGTYKPLETLSGDIVRVDLRYEDKDGYTQNWKTLPPTFEMEYNSSIHIITCEKPPVVERGYFPRMP